MSQEIEIEYKNLLTKEEFDQLLTYFELDNTSAILQENHYFETDNFSLKEKGAALRIREKNNLWQLTLKQPHQEGILETHDTLTEAEAKSWINGSILPKPHVAKQLNEMKVDFATLKYGGSLRTYRIELPYKQTTIVLDRSEYNGKTDYELELEAPTKKHGEHVFGELLTALSITKKTTPNKIARFYESLDI
ncbi:CYTH domain-containing protein [Aquibacillus kalidii]|uniref:CYTH domain-containing protein n=1 Tax=Aquibacillus kalidii TaxID=2762597 RepID=UPI00164838EF|nr:CYTH domain-containing protein [Aquibacillus kalidii]